MPNEFPAKLETNGLFSNEGTPSEGHRGYLLINNVIQQFPGKKKNTDQPERSTY